MTKKPVSPARSKPWSVATLGWLSDARTLRLALEAREPFGILFQLAGQDFDRDLASEPSVASAIDLSHSALAERAQNLEHAQRAPAVRDNYRGF